MPAPANNPVKPQSLRFTKAPARPQITLPRPSRTPGFTDLRTQGVFERIEDKFFVERARLPDLERLLSQTLRPSYLDPQTRFCGVESIYLDSADLNSYKSHFQPQSNSDTAERFKVRLRRYFPDGQPDPTETVLLELKSKVRENNVSRTKKLRFCIGVQDYQELMKGNTLAHGTRLARLNREIPEPQLLERLDQINSLIERFGLRPVCKVSYVRHAYEGPGIRVTYDDQIRYESLMSTQKLAPVVEQIQDEKRDLALQMATAFRTFDGVILEVKHGGEIPAWMTEFLLRTESKKMSFSKYCFSMTDQIFERSGDRS